MIKNISSTNDDGDIIIDLNKTSRQKKGREEVRIMRNGVRFDFLTCFSLKLKLFKSSFSQARPINNRAVRLLVGFL